MQPSLQINMQYLHNQDINLHGTVHAVGTNNADARKCMEMYTDAHSCTQMQTHVRKILQLHCFLKPHP